MPNRDEAGPELTYVDYAAIPADGRRHEILDGQHVVNPAPTPRHQAVSGGIFHQLYARIHATGRGRVFCAPIDVELSPVDIVQPDIVVVAESRSGIVGSAKIEGAPDLLIEVVSPSTAKQDRGAKQAAYRRAGVHEYQVVDPEQRTVEQLVLAAGRYEVRRYGVREVESVAFPGVVVDLGSIR